MPCVSFALEKVQNVVNFLYRSQPAFLKHISQKGMLRRITVMDAFPCSAALTVDIGAMLVLAALVAFLCAMLFTKLSFT